MSPNSNPTEASPLLHGRSNHDSSYQSVVSSDVEPTAINESDSSVDVEQQPNGTTEDENAQMYEGVPALRAKLPFIFPAVAIGVLLAAADQTIIVSSYAKIGSDLDALNRTSWIASSYFLTLTTFQPLYGKLSDIFGRKACLLFAYAVFGTGCLFCGLARNIDELIWARAFSGIGGGGMTTVVSVLLSDIIPLRDRGTWQGYINVVYATGAGAGAPLGGKLPMKWTLLKI
jgi:Major Facilitator Superfamily